MAEGSGTRELASVWTRWARRVRLHLALRSALTGATAGLLLGVGAAALAWRLRLGPLRPYAAALAALGALGGAWWARRRRWSDQQVALYLDRQLDSHETLTTAVELDQSDRATPARAVVLERAIEKLAAGPPKGVWPRVWRLGHGLLPLAAGALVWLSLVAPPPLPPTPPPPPGSELVQLENLAALDKVITLGDLQPQDEAQRKRLEDLSERARKLRAKLRHGMQKRAAQAELAKLRDDVAAERQRFGSGKERAGLEAALGKLAGSDLLRESRRALGDRDLTRFDEQMEELANKVEAHDRKTAKHALEEAAKAAEEAGAKKVAKALREQRQLMAERSGRSKALRELAKAFGDGLSDEAREALKDLDRSGAGADQQRLADALGKTLEGMSDADRKKLAQRLEEQAGRIDPNSSDAMPLDKQQLERLQKQLRTPEGQRQLAEQLKQWANQPPQSGEAQRQGRLGQAERGLGDAQRQLGAPAPMPAPGQGGKPGQASHGAGKPGRGDGHGTPNGHGTAPGADGKDDGHGHGGPSRGGGRGKHGGHTNPVAGDELRSHADGRLNPGAPNPGHTPGRAPGRAGETANKRGIGQLGEVGPGEIGGVEHSEVPEEYREQVGRYFQP